MAEPNEGGQGSDPTQAFQSRLKKHGDDALAFATVLFDENFKLREDKRQLEAKVPKEGSVVLSKADADRWAAFNKLGKKPEEIEAALAEAEKAVGERDTLRRKDTLRDVATAAGYKLSVLQDLDSKTEGLEYVFKDDKDKQGSTRKAAFVKHEGKEVPLEQFAAESWADYLPALKADGGQQPVRPGNGRDPQPAGSFGIFDRIRQRKKEEQDGRAPTRTLAEVAGRTKPA